MLRANNDAKTLWFDVTHVVDWTPFSEGTLAQLFAIKVGACQIFL